MLVSVLAVVAYLFGAIPFGLLVAKSRGVDIRSKGSGNIGATNVFRVVGKGWGTCTFVLDALKGFLPAYAFPKAGACLVEGFSAEWGVLFGLLAIVGHTFPIYLKFKGGKGVATSAGMLLGVAPVAVGVGFVCWLVTVLVSRYVSLGSIIASFAVGITVWVDPREDSIIVQSALSLMSVLVIWLHRANIKRLLNGTENRFGKKKEAAS
ncbi:Glycerol-3-phosphate acyltransferase [Pontiella desulfatans]|uniref:Glycerol-3-phosphate acyltransferase n=1 Tax=Pontiella desulfatans TaxID=2750659 RepID=A0A6C2UB84_PONDE|nr:glycerol-3-phosphate 1-O-acyltransferase PlsY [Pontiella desulfatans]VGO16556.1 Glycerol-3-phosphate acyltransferase [Pontiella desulfatans]